MFRRVPAEDGWSYASLASRALGVQSFIGATVEPVGLSSVAVNDGLGAKDRREGESLANLLGPPEHQQRMRRAGAVEQAVSLGLLHLSCTRTASCFSNEADEAADTQVVGASQSMGHVVLESRTLAGEAPFVSGSGAVTHGNVLCEWAGVYENFGPTATPALRLVDVKPGSEQTPVSECGAGIGDIGMSRPEATPVRPIGRSRRMGRGCSSPPPDPNVPIRKRRLTTMAAGTAKRPKKKEKGPVKRPTTVRADRRVDDVEGLSSPKRPSGKLAGKRREYSADFAGASEDGSRVFFATKTWVTQDHPTGHDLELYECQIVETESGTWLVS